LRPTRLTQGGHGSTLLFFQWFGMQRQEDHQPRQKWNPTWKIK
jgi:hypothetical protein